MMHWIWCLLLLAIPYANKTEGFRIEAPGRVGQSPSSIKTPWGPVRTYVSLGAERNDVYLVMVVDKSVTPEKFFAEFSRGGKSMVTTSRKATRHQGLPALAWEGTDQGLHSTALVVQGKRRTWAAIAKGADPAKHRAYLGQFRVNP